MTLNINVDQIDGLQQAITETILDYIKSRTKQEWYTLKEACALKGSVWNTVRKDKSLQPDGGRFVVVDGKQKFHRTVVEEWLSITDKNRVAYLRMCRERAA